MRGRTNPRVLAALAVTARRVSDALALTTNDNDNDNDNDNEVSLDGKGAVWAQDTIEDEKAVKLRGNAKAMLIKLMADHA